GEYAPVANFGRGHDKIRTRRPRRFGYRRPNALWERFGTAHGRPYKSSSESDLLFSIFAPAARRGAFRGLQKAGYGENRTWSKPCIGFCYFRLRRGSWWSCSFGPQEKRASNPHRRASRLE